MFSLLAAGHGLPDFHSKKDGSQVSLRGHRQGLCSHPHPAQNSQDRAPAGLCPHTHPSHPLFPTCSSISRIPTGAHSGLGTVCLCKPLPTHLQTRLISAEGCSLAGISCLGSTGQDAVCLSSPSSSAAVVVSAWEPLSVRHSTSHWLWWEATTQSWSRSLASCPHGMDQRSSKAHHSPPECPRAGLVAEMHSDHRAWANDCCSTLSQEELCL